MARLLAAGDLGGDVAGGDLGHLLGHVPGLGEVHRDRRCLDGWERDGDADGIDVLEVLVPVVGVDGDESLGVAETG